MPFVNDKHAWEGTLVYFKKQSETQFDKKHLVSDILSISYAGMQQSTIDVSSLDTTGGMREYLPGKIDGGSAEVVGFHSDNNKTRIKEIQKNMKERDIMDFAVLIPQGKDVSGTEQYRSEVYTGGFLSINTLSNAGVDQGQQFSISYQVNSMPDELSAEDITRLTSGD